MRSVARGDGDWVYVGDVRDSVFSIFLWHRRLMAFHGRKRPDAQPFYLDKDQRRPYTYSCGLNDFLCLTKPSKSPCVACAWRVILETTIQRLSR